jgi:thymidylate kinase
MKITAVLVLLASALATAVLPSSALPFVTVLFVAYLATGVLRSSANRIDPLNDVPNALRVLLAGASPLLATRIPQPFGLAAAALSMLGAISLNDEYQRRTVDALREGRLGGSVALLGIDGSGKSTHAAELEVWFKRRGYHCTRVPFHRYLFVEKLPHGGGSLQEAAGGEGRGGNPLRPMLSAVDNLLMLLVTSFGKGLEGRILLYDRYIWSTYVKYAALGYPVRPLRWLYTLPRPKMAVVLDVPVDKSLSVIGRRPDHIRYRRDVLSSEKEEYVRIAQSKGFPIIDATKGRAEVELEIEDCLARLFPSKVN